VNSHRSWHLFFALAVIASLLAVLPLQAAASDTPDPAAVAVAGSLQDELGCPGDWQPDCADTHLTYDAEDTVWQATFNVPAGMYEYKAALNGSWDENYGVGAQRDGANIGLNLADPTDVKFYYDHETHWIADNVNSRIITAPGSFQSELGCGGDWDPSCLRSWLQDPDGDGVFEARFWLPGGSFEAKAAVDESWSENYGAGGVPGGANIAFTVPDAFAEMLFSFDDATKILTIGTAPPAPQPASVTIPGSFQSELGCPGDWQPDCAVTHLGYDAEDTVWQGTFSIPAGDYEYKAALDDSWDVNYGANATQNGPNIGLSLGDPADVKFYYSHATHWVTDNVNATIATVAGSFQSEIGCSGDWQPGCLRSWLQDPDGDGFLTMSVYLPAGSYEAKVAHDEDWAENYGDGGAPGGANIPFTVVEPVAEVFFGYDPVTHLLTIGTLAGPKGNLNQEKAYWLAEDLLAWDAAGPDDTYTLHYAATGGLGLDEDGVTGADGMLALAYDPAGIPAGVAAKFPHLAGYDALRIDPADLAMVPEILKGQMALAVEEPGGEPIDATGLQIPGVLDDLYAYDGTLGITFEPDPVLRVWAPTARSLTLHLFAGADPATTSTTVPMTGDPVTGVWTAMGDPSWEGMYYLYEVEVYVPATGAVEYNLVSDPYSLGLSANSARSLIVDLSDPATMPAGWDSFAKPAPAAPEDIVIYELHVRDFSIFDATVPADLRGTFAAFTETGSDGMQHLTRLSDAGLTHIHLLPVFDIATIEEITALRSEPDPAVLATYPPDSDQQQAAVAAVEDLDGFNWGYDPWHYTTPEGSYSTDPDGIARTVEFRAMVQALNEAGLRVVMDVVYNHTSNSGQADNSVLDRIVPGYYHRLSSNGSLETSTCCANTATEHDMMGKLMVDSIVTWATAYKIDGFRFDLMGHHPKDLMLEIRDALAALTLEADGVDGSSIYLYGEGWNFGEVANDARFEQATQANMAGTGIGSFNDRLRDAVRGGGPFDDPRVQGWATGLFTDPSGYSNYGDDLGALLHRSDWIRAGLTGNLADFTFEDSGGNVVPAAWIDYNGQSTGYTLDPQESINYVSAHDNETLFDAIQLKLAQDSTMEERVRSQIVALSSVALGQGIPFIHAGSDMLRSKSMDRDSYNSGDWFNAIDFTYGTNGWGNGLPVAEKNQDKWGIMQPLLADPALQPAPADIMSTVDAFAELLMIRSSSPLFRLPTAAEIEARVAFHNTGPAQIPGLIVMSISDRIGEDIDPVYEGVVALFNAGDETVSIAAAGYAGTELSLHPVLQGSTDPVVRTASYDASTGTFTIPGRTTAVFMETTAAGRIGDIAAGLEDFAGDEKVAKAIKELGKSLDEKYWAGDDTLDPKHGKKAFDRWRKAVHELEKVSDLDPAIMEAIEAIVAEAERFATMAYEEALAAGAGEKDVAKIMKELDKAAAEYDEGDYDKAVEHYRKAWVRAMKTLD
jgi:pullulanase-type alpha-1,6-glucosidase